MEGMREACKTTWMRADMDGIQGGASRRGPTYASLSLCCLPEGDDTQVRSAREVEARQKKLPPPCSSSFASGLL